MSDESHGDSTAPRHVELPHTPFAGRAEEKASMRPIVNEEATWMGHVGPTGQSTRQGEVLWAPCGSNHLEEAQMNLIKTTGNCGLVLDIEGHPGKKSRAEGNDPLRSTHEGAEHTGHFILSRYRVDDEGHICLTPSLPLKQLYGSIASLKAELESLLDLAAQRFER